MFSFGKQKNKTKKRTEATQPEQKQNPNSLLLALEPRYLYDGAAVALIIDGPPDSSPPESTPSHNPDPQMDSPPPAEHDTTTEQNFKPAADTEPHTDAPPATEPENSDPIENNPPPPNNPSAEPDTYSPLVKSSIQEDSSSAPAAETEVRIDDSGNLVITDINNTGTLDNITLSCNESSVTISDPDNILTTSITDATGTGSNQINVSLGNTDFTGDIIVNTMGGDDQLTIDFAPGSFNHDIVYNGGNNDTADGDVLVLTGGSFTTTTYNFLNEHNGSINLDGQMVNYTNLEPVTSDITATDVTLNYSNTSETITITGTGISQTTVDSTAGEVLTFTNPTNSLTINAGGGNDTILAHSLGTGFAANVSINGGTGADNISIGNGFDANAIIRGNNGNDSISNSGTVQSLNGGEGNDTISNTGLTTYIDGNAGEDFISNSGTTTDFINGDDSSDTVTFSGDNDTILNTGSAYLIYGWGGNDSITNSGTAYYMGGSLGDDALFNSGSVDLIWGGSGNDSITNEIGGTVHTLIWGLTGNNTITNRGAVTGDINGGNGSDTIVIGVTGSVGNNIDGETGNDSITNRGNVNSAIIGGEGNDTITNFATGNVDTIIGNLGNDDITNHGTVAANIAGRAGNDSITNNGSVGQNIRGGTGSDQILNLGTVEQNINGGSGDDILGNAGTVANNILGASGNDLIGNIGTVDNRISGGSGNDLIINVGLSTILGPVPNPFPGLGNGSAGSLQGNSGNDIIIYSQGSVNSPGLVGVNGGNGTDILAAIYNSGIVEGNGSGTVTFGTVTHSVGTDTWDNFESVYILGTLGPDTITIGETATVNSVFTGPGDDHVTYYQGSVLDIIDGGAGWDTLTGIYGDNVTINGTPASGSAVHSGTASPDNWVNFEEFNYHIISKPIDQGSDPGEANNDDTPTTAGGSPFPVPTVSAPAEGHLYLPDVAYDSLNGYGGSPYSAGPGSLVQSMLNSITGSIPSYLGSSGGTNASDAASSDTQAYTEADVDEITTDDPSRPLDKEGFGFETGNDKAVTSPDGPESDFDRSETDGESRKHQFEEGDDNGENDNDNSSLSPEANSIFTTDEPGHYGSGFTAEVAQEADHFENQRLSILSAIQEVTATNGSLAVSAHL